jgi:predicted metal-dependent phosphotriesterase family hydrolase
MRIKTVLGDIAPADLGVCDAHDHLFLRTPRLPGQELDDPDRAAAHLRAFAGLGGRTIAHWTPHGLGRRLGDLAGLSAATGVHIIAATGLHQAVHYDPEFLARIRPGLADLFHRELTDGPAGMIKVAGGFHGLDDHARHTMTAAAEASSATGAPIGVHLEEGTAALDVLDLLCGSLGVPPRRVILGHLNRSPDPWLHRRAAASGAYLCFDGPSRAHHATDWRLFDALAALADAGHADRILIGGDTTTPDTPGIPHLLRVLRPRVEAQLGRDAATAIFETNPARAFAVQR